MSLRKETSHTNSPNQHIWREHNLCIRPVILDVCARYAGRRFHCMQCSDKKLKCGSDNPSHSSVRTGCIGNDIVHSITKNTEETGVDIIVTIELDELNLQLNELIESASNRLHINGILMIVLPVRNCWECLWLAARILLNRRNGGQAQFWSRQRLSTALECCGFKILEQIKIGALSDQRQSIVLVAKKFYDVTH